MRLGRLSLSMGSSPLARGLHPVDLTGLEDGGIIPARAGFTLRRGHPRARLRDHPRSRGVYDGVEWSNSSGTGSSPLARGLHRVRVGDVVYRGIIPARAGFTGGRIGPPRRARDHPRSRGVYSVMETVAGGANGSSPLARGLLGDLIRVAGYLGIIPARAGFTYRTGPCGRRRRDHPRSRGVYFPRTFARTCHAGSSPLARGLHLRRCGRWDGCRIIPARAGFTSTGAARGEGLRDHPRSRGVYSPTPPTRPTTSGSSPLARGLHPPVCREHGDRRIIPARVGFTLLAHQPSIARPDHPRSRGVYTYNLPNYVGELGSSPLARGLHGPPDQDGRRNRIIPARAGFTAPSSSGPSPGLDHPRSRGVYWPVTWMLAMPAWIIPARAGFT